MPGSEARALSTRRASRKSSPTGPSSSATHVEHAEAAASQVRKSDRPSTAADGQQFCTTSSGQPLIGPRPSRASTMHPHCDGPGRHHRERRCRHAGREPQHPRPNGQPVSSTPRTRPRTSSATSSTGTLHHGAQGTVTYTYASQLPFSNVPANCSFRIVGDATGASHPHHRLLLRHQLGGSDRGSRVAGHRRAAGRGERGRQRRVGVLRLRRPAGCQRRPARADERRHGRSGRHRRRERGRQRLVRHGGGPRR